MVKVCHVVKVTMVALPLDRPTALVGVKYGNVGDYRRTGEEGRGNHEVVAQLLDFLVEGPGLA